MRSWTDLFQYKQPEAEMTEVERKLDLLLGDALAENERLRRELKYQDARDNHIGTHGPDCWSFGPKHYDCAIKHINDMARGAIKKIKELQK